MTKLKIFDNLQKGNLVYWVNGDFKVICINSILYTEYKHNDNLIVLLDSEISQCFVDE